MRPSLFFLLLLGISLSACNGSDVDETDSGTPTLSSDAGVQEPEQPVADDECTSNDDCTNGQQCHEKQCLTPSTSNDTFLCSNEDPCPAGQFCFNGLCAIGCLSNGDCATDQYCDTEGSMRCVNRVVERCPQSACEANQDCVDGYCVATAEPSSCTPSADGNDGCDDYSLCLDFSDNDDTDYRCVSFPACPEDGACPTGDVGAVCNDGFIPNKGRICLVGLCDAGEHCPTDATCLDVNAALGVCSDGTFGTWCTSQQDVCVEGLDCTAALPGIPGVCFGDPVVPVTPGLCDENAPCPTDEFCLNGLCAPGCLSNTDCASDQYCDTQGSMRCIASVVTTCPDTPCAENQTCRDGLCVQVQVQTCTPTFDGNDGCDEYSLCLDHADIDAENPDYRCTTMPPCPEDGVCPAGDIGAVCNDGFLQGKARFCLSGLCDDGADCATDFTCIDFNGPLGACSDGSLGMMCSAQQDVCEEGMSCQAVGSDVGVCFPGGPIGGGTCADLGGSCQDAFDCGGVPIFEATDCSFTEVCCPL